MSISVVSHATDDLVRHILKLFAGRTPPRAQFGTCKRVLLVIRQTIFSSRLRHAIFSSPTNQFSSPTPCFGLQLFSFSSPTYVHVFDKPSPRLHQHVLTGAPLLSGAMVHVGDDNKFVAGETRSDAICGSGTKAFLLETSIGLSNTRTGFA